MANAEYRVQFADAVQEAFFNGGSLTVEQSQARWSNHMGTARSGDHRRVGSLG